MAAERSNIRAGILTLGAVGAFSAALWGWNEWRESSRAGYEVIFTAEQGVYGLAAGADVLVGGIKRGVVTEIVPTLANGVVAEYRVQVDIDRMVPLTQATKFEAVTAGINGESILEVRNVGRPGPMVGNGRDPHVAGRLEPGSSIRATTPDALRTFGGTQSAKPMRKLVDAWLPDPPREDALPSVVKHVLDDAPDRGSVVKKGFRDLADRIRPDLEAWRDDWNAIRADAEAAFAKLGAGEGGAPDAVVPQLRALGADVGEMPSIESARTQAASASIDRAVAAAKSLGRKADDLRAMLDDAETSFGAVSADYAIASQELDATWREAVTHPWRLLESPTGALLGAEDRIEVARAFAEAATDHQRAMKGIEDALRRDGELLARSPGLAELLRTRLDAANALFAAQATRAEELLLGAPAARPSDAR